MKPQKMVAIVLAGVATADLLTGNTANPVLPAFIGNQLTQQYDLILIAIAVVLWMN